MKQIVRVLAATVVLALGAAGCGGGSSPTDTLQPADAVRAAVSTTTHEQSSRLAMTIHTDAGAIKVDMMVDGLFDYAHKTGTMSMTIPGSNQKLKMVITPGTMYMTVPGHGTSYYSIPTKDLGGTSFGAATDPTQSLQLLTGLSDDVKSVGTAMVRGDETTHYRGTYDLKRGLNRLTGLAKQQVQKLIDSQATTLVPFDAYIDSDGRLRKMVQVTDTKLPGASGQSVHSTVTMELYDFGTPVNVKIPTDVKDGSAFLGAMKGQLGTGS